MAEDKKHIFKTANIYLQEGRWDKAITEFKRIVAIDPEDLSAHNILGDAYVKKGVVKEAYREYLLAAEGYGKRGEGDRANPIYRKISKLDLKDLPPEDEQKFNVISRIVKGDSAYEEGNFEEAAKSYQEVIKLTPQNVEVTYKLGDIYSRLGRNKEASESFLVVAKTFLDARLFKRALLCYQKVAELDPSNVDARLALADLLAREGQELEARKELQSISEHFISQGQLDKAQSCAQRAIQLKSIDAHYLMGEIYLRRQKYEEARASLESFLKIKANHIPGQYALGVALLNKGSLDDALAAFGKVLGRQADHVESLERLAEIYEKKGSIPDAIVQHLNLAQVFVTQRIMDRAEGALRKALALDPKHLDGHKRLAELFETRGMRREAAQEYLAALNAAKEQNLAAEVQECEQKVRAINPGLLSAPAAAPAETKSQEAPPAPAEVAPQEAPPSAPSLTAETVELPPVAELSAADGPGAVPPPPVEAASPPAAEGEDLQAVPPESAEPAPAKAEAVSAEPELADTLAVPAAPAKPEDAEPAPAAEAEAVAGQTPPEQTPPPAEPAPAVSRQARETGADLSAMAVPTGRGPAKPKAKAALTPQQRAQRMVSMAQSALKQGLYDEALDMLQQAQQLLPDDQELKAEVQSVIKKYTSGAGKKKMPAAAAAAAAAAAGAKAAASSQKADDIESKVRASAEREYAKRQEAQEKEKEAVAAGAPSAKMDVAGAEEQVLAHAGKAPQDTEREPLTETMADLYLKQGHVEEALKIYEKLWEKEPNRADLGQKAAELRERLAGPVPARESKPDLAQVSPPEKASVKPRISYV